MSRIHLVVRPCTAVLLLAAVLLVAACGGSGGGGSASSQVYVAFPPGVSFTEATTVRVRGVTSGVPVSAVTVGGVAATSADGFVNWTAVVPLNTGSNAIPVVATGVGGKAFSAPTLHVSRGVRLSTPQSLDHDVAGNRLLILDAFVDRLVLYDLGTGALTLLSGTGRGTGPAFDTTQAAIFDLPGNRAFVTDDALNAVFAVDLATGDRTFLTGQGAGSGPALSEPRGLVLHTAGNRLLLVDSGIDAVVSVDLTTGARLVLSDAGLGTGTDFSLPWEIQHDVAGNRVFVRDPSVKVLFAVALATGNRTIVVDDSGGAFFGSFGQMVLDLPNNRMLATDSGFDRVFATDLTTGIHTTISSDPDVFGPGALIHDVANGRLIVGQGDYEKLLTIALSDGSRSVLFDQQMGIGPRLSRAESLAFDLPRGRLLVADELVRIGTQLGAVLAVDYGTGNRSAFVVGPFNSFSRPTEIRLDPASDLAFVYSSTAGRVDMVDLGSGALLVLSGSGVGTGESLQFASDLCFDAVGERLLFPIGGSVNGILAVDRNSGNRTIFANASVGTGEGTGGAIAIECDATGDSVYYGTNSAGTIAKVDVASGVRTLVTQDPGVGPSAAGMQAMRLDPAQNRLIVFSSNSDALIAVDLGTGVRTEICGPNVGTGLPMTSVSSGDVNLDLQLAVFSDFAMDWIVVVDLTNGDRVAFSR